MDSELSDIDYPAITFCSQGANKLGIAERLGNHIDPNVVVKNGTIAWIQKHMVKCALLEFYNNGGDYYWYCLVQQNPQSCEVLHTELIHIYNCQIPAQVSFFRLLNGCFHVSMEQ